MTHLVHSVRSTQCHRAVLSITSKETIGLGKSSKAQPLVVKGPEVRLVGRTLFGHRLLTDWVVLQRILASRMLIGAHEDDAREPHRTLGRHPEWLPIRRATGCHRSGAQGVHGKVAGLGLT